MQNYAVRIKRRRDGLIVARIPSLSRAVGYGLDQEEALYELFKSLRAAFKKGGASAPGEAGAAQPALVIC